MIGYVTLGTKNFDKSLSFYDQLLELIGAGRMMETDAFVAWGTGRDRPALSVVRTPADGNEPSVGNGVMIALVADSTDKVDAVHAKALELGESDEGAPGPRGGGFYAGYFRDLDGNKLNAFCISGED